MANIPGINIELERDPDAEAPAAPEDWVLLPSTETTNLESAQTCFAALKRSRRFFQRGNGVVELRGGRLDILKDERLRSSIEACATVARKCSEEKTGRLLLKYPALASAETARMWLNSQAAEALDMIEQVVSAPPMIEDTEGRPCVLAAGYNPERLTFVLDGVEPEQIDHAAALEALNVIFGEFDFVTPSDRSRAIAALVTPALVAGATLSGHHPVSAVEADASQSGKGFLLEIIQAVYGESPSLVALKSGGVGGFDESLSQSLINGRPFIQIDNLRGKLSSQFFEAIMTAPRGGTVPARVPHRGEVQVRVDRFNFQITSNGIEVSPDLANRCSIIRIKKRARFNYRSFPEGDLLEHIKANRGRFLGAVYCLVAHWIERGKPRTADARMPGRFRAWGQSLDWIVRELCAGAPLLDGHEAIQQRVSDPGRVWLRAVAGRIVAMDPAPREEWIASELLTVADDGEEIPLPNAKTGADDDARNQAAGRLLAKLFASGDSIEIDGIEIIRTVSREDRTDGKGEREVKRYRFIHSPPIPPYPPYGSKDQ
jgi:hypothetical protein